MVYEAISTCQYLCWGQLYRPESSSISQVIRAPSICFISCKHQLLCNRRSDCITHSRAETTLFWFLKLTHTQWCIQTPLETCCYSAVEENIWKLAQSVGPEYSKDIKCVCIVILNYNTILIKILNHSFIIIMFAGETSQYFYLCLSLNVVFLYPFLFKETESLHFSVINLTSMYQL